MPSSVLLWMFASCAAPAPTPQTSALITASPGVDAGPPHGKGAVVYVPVYSSIYVGEGNQTSDLTVTLTVRNTDREAPITVTAARYYNTAGGLLHSYVEEPAVLGPLASADTVVRESDTRAGVGGSFVVEWSAPVDVSEPVIEAIMIGAGSQQGISFVSEGRVIERTSAASPPAP